MKRYNVAILGATGAVGEQMIRVLWERRFPIGGLRLLSSERSAGGRIPRSEMRSLGLPARPPLRGRT